MEERTWYGVLGTWNGITAPGNSGRSLPATLLRYGVLGTLLARISPLFPVASMPFRVHEYGVPSTLCRFTRHAGRKPGRFWYVPR